VFRLVLSRRNTVQDFMKRKYTSVYVILLKIEVSILTAILVFISCKFKNVLWKRQLIMTCHFYCGISGRVPCRLAIVHSVKVYQNIGF
jgi:hypothetical protein